MSANFEDFDGGMRKRVARGWPISARTLRGFELMKREAQPSDRPDVPFHGAGNAKPAPGGDKK